MSMSFWIHDLAKRMKKTLDFTHTIQAMNEMQVCDYLTTEINKINFFDFLSKNAVLEEFESDEK